MQLLHTQPGTVIICVKILKTLSDISVHVNVSYYDRYHNAESWWTQSLHYR